MHRYAIGLLWFLVPSCVWAQSVSLDGEWQLYRGSESHAAQDSRVADRDGAAVAEPGGRSAVHVVSAHAQYSPPVERAAPVRAIRGGAVS